MNLFTFHKQSAETLHDLNSRIGVGMQSPAEIATVSGLTLEEIRVKMMLSEIPRENEMHEIDKSYTFTVPAMWTGDVQWLVRRVMSDDA